MGSNLRPVVGHEESYHCDILLISIVLKWTDYMINILRDNGRVLSGRPTNHFNGQEQMRLNC